MKILINLSVIQIGGGVQVALSLIDELTNFTEHEFYYLISEPIEKQLKTLLNKDNLILIKIPPSRIFKGFQSRRLIKRFEEDVKPDVVFTLFGPSYVTFKAPHLCGFAIPHFIYLDSPFFKIISKSEKLKWRLQGWIKFLIMKFNGKYFFTETEDVSKILAQKLSIPLEHVFTVSNTPNGVFDESLNWLSPPKEVKEVKGFKLLTISSYYQHKNLRIIPKVIDYLVSTYPLFDFTFILSIIEEQIPDLTSEHKKHILFLGHVKIEQCPLLYQNADSLFLPTLLECFTVSYLEAMKMNRPILTSDLPFAHDICKEAALYFDPLSPQDIGDVIFRLANDKDLFKKFVHKGQERLNMFGTAYDRAESFIKILKQIATI